MTSKELSEPPSIPPDHEQQAFAQVVELIRDARERAVVEYQTRLPDKKLLQAKLHEFYALSETETE